MTENPNNSKEENVQKLKERFESGELEEKNLLLAAFLGHDDSKGALKQLDIKALNEAENDDEWLSRLSHWEEGKVRGLLASLRARISKRNVRESRNMWRR